MTNIRMQQSMSVIKSDTQAILFTQFVSNTEGKVAWESRKFIHSMRIEVGFYLRSFSKCLT